MGNHPQGGLRLMQRLTARIAGDDSVTAAGIERGLAPIGAWPDNRGQGRWRRLPTSRAGARSRLRLKSVAIRRQMSCLLGENSPQRAVNRYASVKSVARFLWFCDFALALYPPRSALPVRSRRLHALGNGACPAPGMPYPLAHQTPVASLPVIPRRAVPAKKQDLAPTPRYPSPRWIVLPESTHSNHSI